MIAPLRRTLPTTTTPMTGMHPSQPRPKRLLLLRLLIQSVSIRCTYSDEYYCDSDGHLQRHSDQSDSEDEDVDEESEEDDDGEMREDEDKNKEDAGGASIGSRSCTQCNQPTPR